MPETHSVHGEIEMMAFGGRLARTLRAGDVVTLSGPLGAGKTTLARGFLLGLGWKGHVRSPTYNLIHTYPTDPPVMHADLYRLTSADGLGLEEFLDTHLCLIEWPDRLGDALKGRSGVTQVVIEFEGEGRRVMVER
ncbi:MAG TPA: tRNA (adenosine(37)-N6)-threonylcarbamoyltransferase complex ATPase subunit type 1 TsaE [Fimbriimonadaceae bacterium]|nr:tRNA (adenosine(37)-N6)-threonylcarbamoyltransferase complex ATPase subunit type 1 TsaE [Fimbriimonadaceae bacterium]